MRIQASEISVDLRTRLTAATFTGFTLATIPTGRDPRRFSLEDMLPQAVVHISSTVTRPLGIGGHMDAAHGVSIFLIFKYGDGDDINMLKLQHAAELVDWLCDNKATSNYELFLGDDGSPTVDYDPPEERAYDKATPIAILKIEAAVRQTTMFAL